MTKYNSIMYCIYLIWTLVTLSKGDATPIHEQGIDTTAVQVEEGPSSGILVGESPGLLLTERRLVSEIVFVPLDPEIMMLKFNKEQRMTSWYASHVQRTQASVRNAMSHLAKTVIRQSELSVNGRQKRAVGWAIATVVMSVIGLLVGTAMNIANSASISTVETKSAQLRHDLIQIRAFLEAQDQDMVEVISVVNQTIIAQVNHANLLTRMTNLHIQEKSSNDMFWEFVEPLTYATQDYLREIQDSISALIKGQIPLFLVPLELVRNILSKAHPAELEDMQLSIALEMGTAVPLYFDMDKMQISFLLNLPLIIPSKVYQLKKIYNVGTWKNDVYLKVKTPDFIAFQSRYPSNYFIPKLDTCAKFKDIHFLCPGNPFVPDVTGVLCGIQHGMEAQLCDVAVSKHEIHEFSTAAVLVNHKWLVSSRLQNYTTTFTNHGTFGLSPLTERVVMLTIPKDAVVTIGDQVLFHVNVEPIEQGVTMINSFSHSDIMVDENLEYLLQNKPNHTINFTIHKRNLSLSEIRYEPYQVQGGWHDHTEIRLQLLLCMLIASIGWLSVLTYRICCPHKPCWCGCGKPVHIKPPLSIME